MPKGFASCHHWYSSSLNSMKSTSVESSDMQYPGPKLVHTYDNAFHGFSAVMSENELESLKNSPGFLSAYKDGPITPDTTHTYKFLSLNTASGIWPASQFGKDVIIGVVDSGIWPESPSFRDEGMIKFCKKIIGARFFNQGLLANNPEVNISMNSTRDTFDHGTHVASIAVGVMSKAFHFSAMRRGTARGVALARLAVYKVLSGRRKPGPMLLRASTSIADNVDVLSISLSYRASICRESDRDCAFGAMEKRILVSFNGNCGRISRSCARGHPLGVIVASGTVDRWFFGDRRWERLDYHGGPCFCKSNNRNLPLIYNKALSACGSEELLAKLLRYHHMSPIFRISGIFGPNYLRLRIECSCGYFYFDDTSILRSTSFPYPGVVIMPKEGKK
ncbi:hypothetical protein DH2020_027273 [Rehmannia glutinosa]|uniref:Uncharacterized protein n=1 Tax=Rehmannia glutinosa TaxID=99300 RepID=A0ABR0VWE0_REHGL